MPLLFSDSRETVLRAINTMEDIYCVHDPRRRPIDRPTPGDADEPAVIRRELTSPEHQNPAPTAAFLTEALWRRVLHLQEPTVWCLRRQHPSAAVIRQLFVLAGADLDDLMAGRLTEAQFTAITVAAGIVARARLATCHVTNGREFREALTDLPPVKERPWIITDWPLSPAERRAARESRLRVISPRPVRPAARGPE